jgi:FMN reductase
VGHRATVIVGNPKLGSRTAAAGLAVAEAVVGAAGEITLIELADLAPGLLGWGDERVARAKELVLASSLIIVASPVYKASITGMTKAFLDQFGRDELAATAAVPLMVGASATHALAVEHQLRPVLIEIGASCPTRGLFVLESQLEGIGEVIDEWLLVWGMALHAVIDTQP